MELVVTKSERLSRWIYAKRNMLFTLAVVSYLAASSGMLFVEFESDFRAFFKKDSQLIHSFDEMLDQYEQGDTLVLYLRFPEQTDFSRSNLEVVKHVDELVNQLPYVRYVRSISSYQKPFSEGDEIVNKTISEWGSRWMILMKLSNIAISRNSCVAG